MFYLSSGFRSTYKSIRDRLANPGLKIDLIRAFASFRNDPYNQCHPRLRVVFNLVSNPEIVGFFIKCGKKFLKTTLESRKRIASFVDVLHSVAPRLLIIGWITNQPLNISWIPERCTIYPFLITFGTIFSLKFSLFCLMNHPIDIKGSGNVTHDFLYDYFVLLRDDVQNLVIRIASKLLLIEKRQGFHSLLLVLYIFLRGVCTDNVYISEDLTEFFLEYWKFLKVMHVMEIIRIAIYLQSNGGPVASGRQVMTPGIPNYISLSRDLLAPPEFPSILHGFVFSKIISMTYLLKVNHIISLVSQCF